MTDALRARILIASADAPPLRDQVLEIDQQRVRAIRDATDADGPADHDVLLPGLIDAHSHARGIPLSAHGIGAGPLERFLLELGARTPLDPGDEALVAAGDALGAGMTSVQVIHHTFAPADVYVRQVQAIVDSFATIGVRAFVSLALTDQGEYAPAIRGRAVDILPPTTRGVAPDEFPTLASRLLTGSIDAVGPVAPQWCSARALREIGTAARHARVHAHLLESSLQRLGPDGDDVLRLCQAGLLNERSSFAHGVWTDDQQRERLAAARSVIVHCPGSNHRLDVGRCPARRYLDSGVTLALGLDSHGAAERVDMFGEMRAALRTADELDAPIHSAEVLAMATLGGARALCRADLGALHPGSTADIVALDLPGAVLADDPIDHIVRNATRDHVAGTWISGRRAVVPTEAIERARARSVAAIREDAIARARRIAMQSDNWRTVDMIWKELESDTEVVAWRR